jgi:hypothetical protein
VVDGILKEIVQDRIREKTEKHYCKLQKENRVEWSHVLGI